MRTEADLVLIQVVLSGAVELDWERIEQDPAWFSASLGFNLDVPAERQQALFRYLGGYIGRERILRAMPSTCGPMDLFPNQMEVVSGNDGSGAPAEEDQGVAGNPRNDR